MRLHLCPGSIYVLKSAASCSCFFWGPSVLLQQLNVHSLMFFYCPWRYLSLNLLAFGFYVFFSSSGHRTTSVCQSLVVTLAPASVEIQSEWNTLNMCRSYVACCLSSLLFLLVFNQLLLPEIPLKVPLKYVFSALVTHKLDDEYYSCHVHHFRHVSSKVSRNIWHLKRI